MNLSLSSVAIYVILGVIKLLKSVSDNQKLNVRNQCPKISLSSSPCRVVPQYSFLSSLVKVLHYLVEKNNVQHKDNTSYSPSQIVVTRLSTPGH